MAQRLVLTVLVCLMAVSVAYAFDLAKTVDFANRNWDCAEAPSCRSHVREGQYQPNYQCAEFVSRSLVAGGYITGISVNSSQNDYLEYTYKGVRYDLLWVSSKQGNPRGLQDLLDVLGWKNVGSNFNRVRAGAVLFCTGAEGPYSHVAIGIADELTNAHNMAHYHKPPSVYIKVDSIYVP
eukprot:TRINITY_DN4276_c0_g1_i1.p1 TRINITY_DN4276_c0_g1~~TRINITY_DN4276_c0_g1_i1.p1  ORF type:complete len:180 (-),score=19.76 TRINITY_DN4276_c0_g1_i1:89-628(-)